MARMFALVPLVLLLAGSGGQTPLAQPESPQPPETPQARRKCCHGCGSHYCNKGNCGEKCRKGPKCSGCWEGC